MKIELTKKLAESVLEAASIFGDCLGPVSEEWENLVRRCLIVYPGNEFNDLKEYCDALSRAPWRKKIPGGNS
jgi:hypothetical protein